MNLVRQNRNHMSKVIKRVLMFGGNSEERLVSVASAQNLARTMAEKSATPFDELWFVSPSGSVTPTTLDELCRHENPFKIAFQPSQRVMAASIEEAILNLKKATDRQPSVFLGFHGTFGEDGKVQALLEKNLIPFTGSGSKSSHLCFEKNLAKVEMKAKGFKVAPELILTSGDGKFEPPLRSFFEEHGKIVVKPIANGSSIGLHIVTDEKIFVAACADIRQAKYGRFMAEKFIEGRELTVGILESNGQTSPLPPSEVVLNPGASFDYDGKYLGRGTTEVTPAKITKTECEIAQKTALAAHSILGCFGYSRTDLILAGTEIYFIETNTLPGLTKASFIPQQLEAAGLTVEGFVATQMADAEKRATVR